MSSFHTCTYGGIPLYVHACTVILIAVILFLKVNLPAHLVVIKSTMHYIGGMFQECSETQILQMTGRAGRPQVRKRERERERERMTMKRTPLVLFSEKLGEVVNFFLSYSLIPPLQLSS